MDYFDLTVSCRLPHSTSSYPHLLLSSSSSSYSPREVMSRPLTQLLPPDLPAGATSPQFGASNPAGSGPQGGHLTSMTNLKSLLQVPIKADQRGPKDCCEMKGECGHVYPVSKGSNRNKLLKGPLGKYLSCTEANFIVLQAQYRPVLCMCDAYRKCPH